MAVWVVDLDKAGGGLGNLFKSSSMSHGGESHVDPTGSLVEEALAPLVELEII